MFAVIATGGKQYLVTPNQQLNVEKLDLEVGKTLVLDQVLLSGDENSATIGTPVTGGKVTVSIVEHGRTKKVTGIKFHNKVRYQRKFGHRQHYTKIKIESIS